MLDCFGSRSHDRDVQVVRSGSASLAVRGFVPRIALVLCLLLLPLTARAAPEFVKVDSGTLRYRGAAFHIAGANSYSLLYSFADAEKQFKEARSLGLNTMRMWGFWNGPASWTRGDGSNPSLQPSAGMFPEQAWVYFDYVIALAQLYDIKLIIPLNNNWGGAGNFGGTTEYLQWAGANIGNNSEFWTNAAVRDLYKAYVLYTLNRENTFTKIKYKDDPAIMIWEVINEPRNKDGGDSGGGKVAAFLNDMGKLIHDNDAHHLVATGEEGFLRAGQNNVGGTSYPWVAGDGEGTNFVTDAALSNIDVLTIHLWPWQWDLGGRSTDIYKDFIPKWISEHVRLAKAAGKPLYLGEFGLQVRRIPGNGLPERDAVFQSTFDAVRASSDTLSGALYWNMLDKSMPEATYANENFDVFCPVDTTTCGLIQKFASDMVAKNPPPSMPTCAPGQTACAEDCVDLQNQAGPLVKHCGTCQVTCSPGQSCGGGVCGVMPQMPTTGGSGGTGGAAGSGVGGGFAGSGGTSGSSANPGGMIAGTSGIAPVGSVSGASGGAAGSAAGTQPNPTSTTPMSNGCGCRLDAGRRESGRSAPLLLAALGFVAARRRRR